MVGEDSLLLPPEIWSEIFNRLPVKSILRCRSVCKSWHSLISNPDFISSYKSGNRLLLKLDGNRARTKMYSLISHDESFVNPREHDDVIPFIPERLHGRDLVIVGSCNGLICLALIKHVSGTKGYSVFNFLIWNPAIRKIVELPTCSRRNHRLSIMIMYPFYYGFGFDYKSGDYKVVFGDYKVLFVCNVLDLSKCDWRNIDAPSISYQYLKGKAQCYLNGAVHWIARERYKREYIILAFSIGDEVFREITMPDCYCSEYHYHDRTQIVALGGLICVVEWKTRGNDFIGKLESYSVWAMKEYGVAESWSKVFNVDRPSARVLTSKRLWPHMFLWENGEVRTTCDLEVDEDGDFEHKQDLVLYSPESRKFKCPFSVSENFADFCFYKESLVLM